MRYENHISKAYTEKKSEEITENHCDLMYYCQCLARVRGKDQLLERRATITPKGVVTGRQALCDHPASQKSSQCIATHTYIHSIPKLTYRPRWIISVLASFAKCCIYIKYRTEYLDLHHDDDGISICRMDELQSSSQRETAT